jgi:disulfide oxidoreductase YuzD
MKKILLFVSVVSVFLSSCVGLNTSKEVIADSRFFIDRESKQNIIEFPQIDYINVSNQEKKLFNTIDVPHVMEVSYLIKVIITKDNKKLFVLQCAFSAQTIKDQPFKIEKMFNKEDQLLNAKFERSSQSQISFDFTPSFDFLHKENVNFDDYALFYDSEGRAYPTMDYHINYDLDANAVIYYSIPLSYEYLVNHKDEGIVIKAYARGKYGRMFFHIAPFYIQGVLERTQEQSFAY